MPYIKPEYRELFDDHITGLQEVLRQYPLKDRKGMINYIITRVNVGGMDWPTEKSYAKMADIGDSFLFALLEFYRRTSSYEDEKMMQNGDIPEYQ